MSDGEGHSSIILTQYCSSTTRMEIFGPSTGKRKPVRKKKRSGQLVPFGTAIRLTNVRRCTSCFNVGTVTRKQ